MRQRAWEDFVATGSWDAAADAIGVHRRTVQNWVRESGGVRPRHGLDSGRVGTGRRLGFEERMEIQLRREGKASVRSIAAGLGRAPSTISRELRAHGGADGTYRADRAHELARRGRCRGQRLKLGVDTDQPRLRSWVVGELAAGLSPEQVSGRLAVLAGSDPEYAGMSVHHETIYRAMFLQARGGLLREVKAALKANQGSGTGSDDVGPGGSVLRSGRTARKPRTPARPAGPGRIPDMVPIGQRPPIRDADGVLLPGHSEGDLILGSNSGSAIGTVVERSTGYLWLLHLPKDHTAAAVEEALITEIARWPQVLRESLTWDQGKELSNHVKIADAANIKIYFADPRSPWQRPGNENMNGLLRQYFPKGTDLSVFTRGQLDYVADLLNSRPRARFGFRTPYEMMNDLLLR